MSPVKDDLILLSKEESLEMFFYWINERHRIYLKRLAGEPKPWTVDKILQQYKFTNVFRELDTGTIWLRENLIEPNLEEKELLLFNVCWYRYINYWPSAKEIGFIKRFDPMVVEEKLRRRRKEGKQIFTGAYMLSGWSGTDKIDQFVFHIMKQIWEKRKIFYSEIVKHNTLQDACSILMTIKGIASFLSYEIATDLYHTHILRNASDIMNWANAGPGAIRGIWRLFGKDVKSKEANGYMKSLLIVAPQYLEDHVLNSGQDLDMRMIEMSLCEYDKYMRVYNNEGRPRSRYPGTIELENKYGIKKDE